MKLDILKYTGLGIIGIFLIYANINMIGNLFFSDSDKAAEIKKFVIPSNEAIADTLRSLWSTGETNNGEDGFMSFRAQSRNLAFNTDSLVVLDDPIESNKRHIIYCDSLIAYAYVIHEQIACPTCSDINYLLITDNEYTIKHIFFLRDIVEGYKIIPIEKFEEFSNKFLNLNLLNDDFMMIKVISNPEKHSLYFKESIKNLQKQVRLFYEE